MRKSVLLLAATSMLFSSVVSCKDAEEKQEMETPIETGVGSMESDTPMESDTTANSSKELENTSLVESGTYTGTAKVVDQQQKEVYVSLNDTTTIELYFSNDTQIVQNGNAVQFDALAQGQKLEVQVEKSGESLKPIKVTILQ